MMDERSSRIFIGLCLLVLVWIGVYWMWQPSNEQTPTITFEQPIITEATNTDQPPSDPPDIQLPTIIDQIAIAKPEINPEPTPTPKDDPKLIRPEFFKHIVQPNERMQTIAAQYFDSGDDWPIIARANPFVDPQKLSVGMVLRIPKDPTNIQGRLTGRETHPGVIESHIDDPAAVIEYVVRPGDSLSRISQRIYGSARHARFIYDANRDKLRSMDDISVGQLLKLPPLPEGETQEP